jgi:hypothetical protein
MPFLVIVALGTYLVCGILWARHNRMRRDLERNELPDLVLILLWPLQFYTIYLSRFWHPRRFRLETRSEAELRQYLDPIQMTEKMKAKENYFPSWSGALAYALQAAKQEGHQVTLIDSARYDNVYGRLMQRRYWVEPSGEVTIACLRKRIIRKADS